MKYKIDIWIYETIEDTYESDDLQDAVQWYKDSWSSVWDNGGCSFASKARWDREMDDN